MNLQHRIDLLVQLGQYILADNENWLEVKEKASYENGWFTPMFVTTATQNIATEFLQKEVLENWTKEYSIESKIANPQKVGIVMAGNIPLVGFHDFLCVFISGNIAVMKSSSKDNVLIKDLVEKIIEWDADAANYLQFAEMLKDCDAYIATGSNNSSRYFEYYFAKYPHIIRKNRTSVAIITGNETTQELEKLADDVYYYFGLGCRNVTKIYVPVDYDFVPLIEAFNKYQHLADHHKYKNNYDYNLALHMLNKVYYMTNGSILLIEDKSLFSPISQLNYEFYTSEEEVVNSLKDNPELQCITGNNHISLGTAQCPSVNDYADGVDTMSFLTSL
ncbi:MAG: acyl-CoA reductase [Chitinophagaceae bacterium]|nr:acyl-CoA reductase [Chitinophagaceae bacterium]